MQTKPRPGKATYQTAVAQGGRNRYCYRGVCALGFLAGREQSLEWCIFSPYIHVKSCLRGNINAVSCADRYSIRHADSYSIKYADADSIKHTSGHPVEDADSRLVKHGDRCPVQDANGDVSKWRLGAKPNTRSTIITYGSSATANPNTFTITRVMPL